MTDTEPIHIQKWMIAVACFLCVICFGLGCFVGYSVTNDKLTETVEPTVEETVEESTSIETLEETTEEETEVIIETIPETTETIEIAEPSIEEIEYYEPEPTKSSSETIIGMSDLEMLACVIFQEVGGDIHCDNCRRRVADIVLNRVASDDFPNTIYEVLTEQDQYGMFYYTGIKWADRAKYPEEAHAVERAWRIAEEVLNGRHSEVYGQGYIWQAGFEQGSDGFWCCGHFFGR